MDEDLRIVSAPSDPHQASIGNLASVVIDGAHAEVDPGALHGRSRVEAGVRWVGSPDEVPAGRVYWVAWVTAGRREDGQRGYKGLTVSRMLIDRQAGVGHKHLAQHVNAIRAAMEGQVDLDGLPAEGRRALRILLAERAPALWEHARPQVRRALEAGA